MAKGRTPDDILKGLGGISGIKLGKGIVGKTGYIAVIAVVAWIAIIWRMTDNILFDAMLLAVGLIVTLFAWWAIRASYSFASENPGVALLEGAEVIAYREMEIAAASKPGTEITLVNEKRQGRLKSGGSADAG